LAVSGFLFLTFCFWLFISCPQVPSDCRACRSGSEAAGRLRHTQDEATAANFKDSCDARGRGVWPNGQVVGDDTLRYPDNSTSPAEDLMSKPKPSTPHPAEADQDRLDEALEETFPASDPIAIEPDEEANDGANDSANDASSQAPAREKKRH
jgi:hypothetical protein